MEESIIDRLIKARTALGLNQGKFAEKIGLSQSAVSDFENNKKALIDRNIKVICLVFGINEDWLRTGNGDMLKENAEIQDEEGKPLTYEEGKFINTYRKLTDPNKEVAKTTVDALLKSQGGVAEKGEKVEPTGIGPGNNGKSG